MIETQPFGQIVPFGIEYLDAVVLAIADEETSIGQYIDAVRRREFSGPGTEAAPALLELAVRGKPVNHHVAVAVRDIDVAVRMNRDVGRMTERRLEARTIRFAQRE